jgi:hypothetical protein
MTGSSYIYTCDYVVIPMSLGQGGNSRLQDFKRLQEPSKASWDFNTEVSAVSLLMHSLIEDALLPYIVILIRTDYVICETNEKTFTHTSNTRIYIYNKMYSSSSEGVFERTSSSQWRTFVRTSFSQWRTFVCSKRIDICWVGYEKILFSLVLCFISHILFSAQQFLWIFLYFFCSLQRTK